MAGFRVSRRVAIVLGLIVCVAVLSQLFKYGPAISRSEKERNDEGSTVTLTAVPSDRSDHKYPGSSSLPRGQYAKNKTNVLRHKNKNSLYKPPVSETKYQGGSDKAKTKPSVNTSANSEMIKPLNSQQKSTVHHQNGSSSLSVASKNQTTISNKVQNYSRNPIYDKLNELKKKQSEDYKLSPTQLKSAANNFGRILSNASVPKSAATFQKNVLNSSLPAMHNFTETWLKGRKSQLTNQVSLRLHQTEDSKITCPKFYEEANNPTLWPVPVCSSKDYPSHAVHCYQSIILSPDSFSPKADHGNVSLKTQRYLSTLANLGVTCTFKNIAVNVKNILHSLNVCTRNCDVRNSNSLFLTQQSKCPLPTISTLMNITDEQDDTRNFVHETVMLNSKKQFDPSKCSQWINETAFFFISNEPHNIYFQFLTYYNIFTSTRLIIAKQRTIFLGLNGQNTKKSVDPLVVRISGIADYHFSDFERKLFPRITDLRNLTSHSMTNAGINDTFTCFHSLLKVPWVYSALPFQCVIDDKLRNETFRCYDTWRRDSKLNVQEQGLDKHAGALNNAFSRDAHLLLNQRNSLYQSDKSKRQAQSRVVSSLLLFRNQVLRVCGIKEDSPLNSFQSSRLQSPPSEKKASKSLPLNVLFIKRKPYLRHGQDAADLFQRVLANEKELETTLVQNTSSGILRVKSVFMEELKVCEQVMLAHNADIIIGVHGAGLVHSWWMKEGSALLEIVPLSKLSRPTYKVLAGLTGTRYYSVVLDDGDGKHDVFVSVSAVMEALNRISKQIIT